MSPGVRIRWSRNAAKVKHYTSALHCFLIAGRQGNAGAQSLAGPMLREGVDARPNDPAAFYQLEQSAEQDDYNGKLGLSQMYESGMCAPKDPEKAVLSRNRAQKRAQGLRAQQAQRQANQVIGVLLLLAWQLRSSQTLLSMAPILSFIPPFVPGDE